MVLLLEYSPVHTFSQGYLKFNEIEKRNSKITSGLEKNVLQRKMKGALPASYTKGRQGEFITMQEYPYSTKHEIQNDSLISWRKEWQEPIQEGEALFWGKEDMFLAVGW